MSGSFERIPDRTIWRPVRYERASSDSAPRAFVPSIGRVPLALQHSTAQAIRQSSLIHSQHSPGNASVQRMIATTIMRCGCAPGEACSCGRGGADAEREKKEGSR